MRDEGCCRARAGRGASGTPPGCDSRGRRDPWGAVGEWGRRPGKGRPPTAMIGHPFGMVGMRDGGCVFFMRFVLACGSRVIPEGWEIIAVGRRPVIGQRPRCGRRPTGCRPPDGRIPEGCRKRKPKEQAAAPHPGAGLAGISIHRVPVSMRMPRCGCRVIPEGWPIIAVGRRPVIGRSRGVDGAPRAAAPLTAAASRRDAGNGNQGGPAAYLSQCGCCLWHPSGRAEAGAGMGNLYQIRAAPNWLNGVSGERSVLPDSIAWAARSRSNGSS